MTTQDPTAEPIDAERHPEPVRTERPPKSLPCVFPGCTHLFRVSTRYGDFLGHYERVHKGVKP